MNEEAKGRRIQSRLRVNFAARLTTTQAPGVAAIVNISQEGAAIKTTAFLKPGFDVVLTFLSFQLFCQVVWTRSGFAGLKFESPLNRQTILILRKLSDEFTGDEDDLNAAKDWTDGKARFNSSD